MNPDLLYYSFDNKTEIIHGVINVESNELLWEKTIKSIFIDKSDDGRYLLLSHGMLKNDNEFLLYLNIVDSSTGNIIWSKELGLSYAYPNTMLIGNNDDLYIVIYQSKGKNLQIQKIS